MIIVSAHEILYSHIMQVKKSEKLVHDIVITMMWILNFLIISYTFYEYYQVDLSISVLNSVFIVIIHSSFQLTCTGYFEI